MGGQVLLICTSMNFLLPPSALKIFKQANPVMVALVPETTWSSTGITTVLQG
jgi:hypothetical protein